MDLSLNVCNFIGTLLHSIYYTKNILVMRLEGIIFQIAEEKYI